MTTILVVNGPNLNNLGTRASEHYGTLPLSDIEDRLNIRAEELDCDLIFRQSNFEGELVNFINQKTSEAKGIIINPAGLTRVGYPLLDACIDSNLPFVEVHLSNIYRREEWRSDSIFSKIANATVSGMQWRGYMAALEYLASVINVEDCGGQQT